MPAEERALCGRSARSGKRETMGDWREVLRERHSARSYEDRQVERGKIRCILEAGRLAPSAKNRQPWFFIVAEDAERLALAQLLEACAQRGAGGSVRETAEILRSAPLVIAIFLNVSESTASDYISLGACLENMCLAATDLGLGSLIVCDGDAAKEEIAALFGREDVLGALFVAGYERGKAFPRQKKPLSQLMRSPLPWEETQERNAPMDDLPQADITQGPFLFISYSHKDSACVLSDIREMKRHGVRLWYDRSILYGEKWDDCALDVMDRPNCAGVLIYVSESSARSENVARELKHAANRFAADGRSIVGVHIGDRVLSSYLGTDEQCNAAFTDVLSDQSKYIARSESPAQTDAVAAIAVWAAERGAAAESGVYDDFRYRLDGEEVELTAYSGCSSSVRIPEKIANHPVVRLGKNMFQGNDCVRQIFVPSSVRIIGDGAFKDMRRLEEVDLPYAMDRIGVAAFRDCTALRSLRLPQGIPMLEEALFRGCTALEGCDVPDSVRAFGEAVFNGCRSLQRVCMPSVLRMTDGGFFGCAALRELILSEHLEGLTAESFAGSPLLCVEAGGFVFCSGTGKPKDR